VTTARGSTFPLVPVRRFVGQPGGVRRSMRRGDGDEVVGSRPYRPGDPVSTIDWATSARLSAARSTDVFVVNEHYAAETPRVAVAVDPRPAMALYGPPFPWLDKAAATDAVARLIGRSARASRVEVVEPRRAAQDLGSALRRLALQTARLPTGSFVFVVSDFLADLEPVHWLRLRARAWDAVPVVVQDPTWERSFPEVGGLAIPFVAAEGGAVQETWLSRREARGRRAANEERFRSLLDRFRRLGLDPVVVDSADPDLILRAFLGWATRRRRRRRRAA
jgi:uncharacterized protein (DUF58 family)